MLKDYVKPHTSSIVINVLIKASATLFEVALPAILAFMIDDLVRADDTNGIIFWGIMMIVFSFVGWIGNVIANRMASYTSAIAIRNIRHDLFKRAMNLSPRQLDDIGISSLETRLTTDTYNIHRFLGATLRMGVRSIMLFAGGVIFCLILEWRLALILLVMVPPIVILVRRVFGKGMGKFRHLQKVNDDMVQVIRENVRGIRVSKALDKTEFEQGRYEVENHNLRKAEIDVTDTMATISPTLNSILYIGQVLVIIFGALLANQGITYAGAITAFLTYFIQITNSLMGMNRMFNIYTRSKTSIERISYVLNLNSDDNQITHEPAISELPESNPEVPEIEFKDVTFTYEGHREDIKNVSFKIYPGETLGLIGATGSGKSTIIRLLLRQYDPQAGAIYFRGINIKRIPGKLLHENFGAAFQNDFIFGGTIEKNIAFGRDLDGEEILYSTVNAQATEFIEEREGTLDYRLAARGVNLSGGQKQRVLLSRALAGEPQVLILDDSSSALDFKTDANLRQAIKEHYSDTTSIIVAQRVSSIMHSENIILIRDGAIVAQGTHAELLESSDIYAEIAEMQLGHGVAKSTVGGEMGATNG